MTALWLLLGCSLRPAAEAVGSVPFPHPANVAEPAVHGPLAVEVGAGACNTCHDEAGSAARPCASCHPAYPHAPGWLSSATHGAGLTGEGGPGARATCDACHALADSVAATTAACTGCHASYPHPAGWTDAGQHGSFALARGSVVAACGSCHGSALEGAGDAAACTGCHPTYPHGTAWIAAEHGATFLADQTACASCHGADGTGGTAGVSCTQCHLDVPHPAGWSTGHLALANVAGARSCATCHDEGEGPAGMPAACGDGCHAVTP